MERRLASLRVGDADSFEVLVDALLEGGSVLGPLRPALRHEGEDLGMAVVGRFHAVALQDLVEKVLDVHFWVGDTTEGPHLPQGDSVAPHIRLV